MNRFKKFVKSQGFKLENDYPWLPYQIGSGPVTLEGVNVNSENCCIQLVYDVDIVNYRWDQHGKMYMFEYDEKGNRIDTLIERRKSK